MGINKRTFAAGIAVVAASIGVLGAGPAQVSKPGQYQGFAPVKYDGYQRSSFYITMRDGTKLAADLFRPTKGGVLATEKLPVVWMHTPYNRRTYSGGPAVERYPGYAINLAKYGYNIAVVDFRGVYASGGRNTGYNRGEWVDAAKMDAWDVTEWFAAQPFSTGKIGMWGCSATGGSQMQAATSRPPHLKAIIPMSAEFDAYGAFVVGGAAAPARIAPPGQSGANSAVAGRDRAAVPVDGPDGAAQLAAMVAQHKDNIESPGLVPNRDSISGIDSLVWWSKSSPSTQKDALQASGIGVYAVANWDEAGTRHGAFLTYNNLPKGTSKLLVGPATHCAWSAVKDETGFDLVTEELRFYDYWLKGVKNGLMSEPGVTYYTYNAPKESQWRTAKSWPLPNEKRTTWYLQPESLTPVRPAVGTPADKVAMSPPVQAQSTTVTAPSGGQAYTSTPLYADMEVTGHPVVNLWISTDAPDVDVLAKLDDVAPDGSARSYQMIGRLRASHRAVAKAPYNHLGLPWHSFTAADARPLTAGQPAELTFDMLPMSYIFKKGHRVRLTLYFTDPQGRSGQPPVTVMLDQKRGSTIVLPVIPTKG